MKFSALIFVFFIVFGSFYSVSSLSYPYCIGSYEYCSNSGACVLNSLDCNICKSGQYICPISNTCVNTVDDLTSCPGLNGTLYDNTVSISERVSWTINHLNISEKISQLWNESPSIHKLSIPSYQWLNDNVHGVMQHAATVFPDGCGLGATWNRDIMFQSGYAIGAESRGTYNKELNKGNRGQGFQNGVGITLYSPNMNLVRDPRWGRGQEVYGEDPFLTAGLMIPFVQGIQGANDTKVYQLSAACCKHYAAYDIENIPENRVVYNAVVNNRNMWESYLPVFEQCVKTAETASIMCSYNLINGVPTCGDPNLMNGILRDQWKFEGWVMSDYDAWAYLNNTATEFRAQLYDTKHYCDNYECAAAVGLKAGCDQEGGGHNAIDGLQSALNDGKVTEADIDIALSRLLKARIQLGMFDPPTQVPYNLYNNGTVDNHFDLALAAAKQVICLYKNSNNILPLAAPGVLGSILVMGYNAISPYDILGNYDQSPIVTRNDRNGLITPLQALYNYYNLKTNCEPVNNGLSRFQVGQWFTQTYTVQQCESLCTSYYGCTSYTWYMDTGYCYLGTTINNNNNTGSINPVAQSAICGLNNNQITVTYTPGCLTNECGDSTQFHNAANLAATYQTVLIFIGMDTSIESEGGDRYTYDLPENQYTLVSDVRKTMKSTQSLICIFIHGSTFSLKNLQKDCDVIVDAWYNGIMGGIALVQMLFGEYSPAGRTPNTWYVQDSDLLPGSETTMDWYQNSTLNHNGYSYRYYTGETIYGFGYGLSYTTFQYENLQISYDGNNNCGGITVQFIVTNTGKVDSDEVVQVYIKHQNPSVPTPNIRLVGFDRIHIPAGQSVKPAIQIDPNWYAVIYNGDSMDIYQDQRMLEKGNLEVYVGGGQPSAGTQSGTVTFTNTVPLASCTH